MIVLGVVLLVVGFLLAVALVKTIGIVVLVIGVAFWVLGRTGHPVGGRRHYFRPLGRAGLSSDGRQGRFRSLATGLTGVGKRNQWIRTCLAHQHWEGCQPAESLASLLRHWRGGFHGLPIEHRQCHSLEQSQEEKLENADIAEKCGRLLAVPYRQVDGMLPIISSNEPVGSVSTQLWSRIGATTLGEAHDDSLAQT